MRLDTRPNSETPVQRARLTSQAVVHAAVFRGDMRLDTLRDCIRGQRRLKLANRDRQADGESQVFCDLHRRPEQPLERHATRSSVFSIATPNLLPYPDRAKRVGTLATQFWRDAIAKSQDGFRVFTDT